jgi:hypothetical protein
MRARCPMSAASRESPARGLLARAIPCVLALTILLSPERALAGEDRGESAAGVSRELVAQGLAYEHGEGVPRDQRKASLLYCEAARAGDAEAMFNLGWMYANGRGVARSDPMAAFLFARAAAAGHVYAREMQRYVGADSGAMPDCMRGPEPDPPAALVADGPDPFRDLPPDKRKIAELVIKAAGQYAIEPRLALAVIATESNFRPDARSARDAHGLMQLVPTTAARFKVRNRLDVKDNVKGGLSYLRWLLAYYQGQVTLAVAAYNAGEAAVDRYRGVPPYPETRDYVQRVHRLFPNERHSFDPSIVGPSAILIRSDDATQ